MRLIRTIEFFDSTTPTLVDSSFDTAYIDHNPSLSKLFEQSDLIRVTFELLNGRKITYARPPGQLN